MSPFWRCQMTIRSLVFGAGMAAVVLVAEAAPVDVTFTTSGSPGDWVYDFSVTDNLGGTNDLYFFGVQAPAIDIINQPAGWTPGDIPWDNSIRGGSSTVYNNNWCCNFGGITPGQTVSGFLVGDTSTTPLTSIPWFAYAYGGTYTGGGNFSTDVNPGFEGVAGAGSVIPEPSTWAMMLLGFAGLGFAGYRRRTARLA
jgi:hypothetical protein